MPVSETDTATQPAPSRWAWIAMRPWAGVNFQGVAQQIDHDLAQEALVAAHGNRQLRPPGTSIRMSFASAWGASSRAESMTSRPISTGTASTCSLPASILAMSRMSLMICRRWVPLASMSRA